jgi:hypothetical protein
VNCVVPRGGGQPAALGGGVGNAQAPACSALVEGSSRAVRLSNMDMSATTPVDISTEVPS